MKVKVIKPDYRQAESLVGQTLSGIYLVERLLGSGSVGEVYLARNLRTDGRFAIKVLRPQALDGELRERFRNEARAISRLLHPGVVRVFDFAELPDGRPYMVMEHLRGESLEVRQRRIDRFPVQAALRIARQLACALHEAHKRGIVHRDLKPENVILTTQEQGDELTEQATIIDFGMSRIRDATMMSMSPYGTMDNQILGTPQYMSPEAAQGMNSRLDGRSDQFSLAVILYRMLTGVSPFQGKDIVDTLHHIIYKAPRPLSELRPDVPGHVAQCIHRALSKCKVERFPTVIDFVRALEGQSPLPGEIVPFEGDDTVVDASFPPGLAGVSVVAARPARRRMSARRAVGLGVLLGALALLPLLYVPGIRLVQAHIGHRATPVTASLASGGASPGPLFPPDLAGR